MQLCNIIVRLGGSLLNTVYKQDATPAEILILQHIHGEDAVVDVRPTRVDKRRLVTEEWDRLVSLYDNASGPFTAQPGDEDKSVMARLFPGAMRKLPTTLKEIGMGNIDGSDEPAPRRGKKSEEPPAGDPPAEEGSVDAGENAGEGEADPEA